MAAKKHALRAKDASARHLSAQSLSDVGAGARARAKTSGFTMGAVIVLLALCGVLSFAEWKRRDEVTV